MTAQANKPLSVQRHQAKAGMALALGVLVGSGILARMEGDRKLARKVHLVAGAALVGLSCWHVSLYNRSSR